jgi:uncharacterized protein YdhG (YjbR/CyaY superfamily)
MSVIVPGTGELVDIASAASEALAEIFDAIADAEQQLRTQKRELIDEIAKRLDHDGRRSLRVSDSLKFEVNAPTEKVWDLDELRATLAELVAEKTITERKSGACIKWEPKPVWSELKTLLSDPRCKARVEHCYSEQPTNRYARVVR